MDDAHVKLRGKVKNFFEKGFGFIVPDDGGRELLFHISGVDGEFEPTAIEFVVGVDCHGRPKAEQVNILERAIEGRLTYKALIA